MAGKHDGNSTGSLRVGHVVVATRVAEAITTMRVYLRQANHSVGAEVLPSFVHLACCDGVVTHLALGVRDDYGRHDADVLEPVPIEERDALHVRLLLGELIE